MIRNGFVGIAGVVVAAVFLGQGSAAAQSAAPKASAPPAAQKAEPAQKAAPSMPEKAAPAAERPAQGSGGVVPAKTPTQQPNTGAAVEAKVTPSALMSVRIPKKVMADGKPLAAGTYTVRITDDSPSKVVGQTQSQQKWVEFVQGGQVKGREIADVLPTSEARTIAKQGLPPAGGSKVETLYGNDYLRVWVNKAGNNYLVYLSAQGM
jgi:hypothetical protein